MPTAPNHYKIYTRDNQNGIELTAEETKKLSKSAFMCYGGFPAREIKVIDLLKNMIHCCWKADYKTVMLTSMISGLIPLETPVITETIFQDIIPILDRRGLATVTQALMVTSFTMAALGIVRSIAVLRISTKIELSCEAALWGRLMSLPSKFFRRYTVGELASRMSGISVIKGLISGEFVGSVFGFIFSFWSIFLMCYYSLKLTAAALFVWIIYSIFIFFVYRRVIEFNREIIACCNKTAGTVQQIFAGLAKFRVQGAEEQAFRLWARSFGEQWNWGLKLRWQNNYTSVISSIQPFILTMLLYYIAVYDQNTGIGYAQFLAFNAAYTSFNGTLGQVLGFIGTFFGIQPQLENLRPILKEVPENVSEKADSAVLSGVIEVSHLTFCYEGSEREVLKDISFKIAAGENVAIVGKSGCGKSTLVRLLLGFETPKSGAIYYDGQDLAELSLPSVRTQLGVVLQNGQLMTGDIYTNIVGTRLLTQDDAWSAAAAAGIAQDIAEMPMGMQTVKQANSNVQRAQSTYSQTLSNVQRAEAALTNATNVYNRQQRLMARNATSQEKLEASQAEYTAAMEAVKAATAESDSARTAIEIAKSELQQYEIQSTRQDVIAPIDGNILLIYKREGAYVQGGTPLALIGNFDTLLFTTTLENADTKYLQIGGIVEIDFNERSFSKAYDTEYSAGNLGKSEKITARIKEINPPPNQSAVMRRVLWEVNNQSHMLEPLTYNNVSIQAGVGHNCLTVPLSAMVDSAHDSVFVVSPEGIIERRTVTVGSDDGEFIEILSGLQLEEIVVVESFEGLEDGVKVEVTIEGETNDRKN